jgi:pyruvate/2-oxoglutarate dehydrogenase complex dihydrolipoamide acyltransferase (E2) component
MKFRNQNNDQVVDTEGNDALRERLEGLANWHPLDGNVELDGDQMTEEEFAASLTEADEDELALLAGIVNREVAARGLSLDASGTVEVPSTTGAAEMEPHREGDTTAPKNDDVPEPGEPGYAPDPDESVDEAANGAAKAAAGQPMTEENGADGGSRSNGGDADHADDGTDDGHKIEATGAAAQLALAEDIDLASIKATGTDGKITINDVRKAVDAKDAE